MRESLPLQSHSFAQSTDSQQRPYVRALTQTSFARTSDKSVVAPSQSLYSRCATRGSAEMCDNAGKTRPCCRGARLRECAPLLMKAARADCEILADLGTRGTSGPSDSAVRTLGPRLRLRRPLCTQTVVAAY